MIEQHKMDAATDSPEISPRFLSQLGPLLILTSIFFLNFISRIILAPLIPEIEIAFNLTHAGAGALFFLSRWELLYPSPHPALFLLVSIIDEPSLCRTPF